MYVDSKIDLVIQQKRDANRRNVIFSETVEFDGPYERIVVPKDDNARSIIMEALSHSFLFALATKRDLEEMADAMTPKNVKSNEVVIKEGDSGDFFYVVESGTFAITVSGGETMGILASGTSFGELALLHNSPRAATITSVVMGTLWALDRNIFRRIVARNEETQLNSCRNDLRHVELLQPLTDEQLSDLANVVQTVHFNAGERIINKGDPGNVLYILKTGSVTCTDMGKTDGAMEDLTLHAGDYFGERALMTNEPRAANVDAATAVESLALDRQAFNEILGPLHEVIDKNMGIRVLKSIPILQALSSSERDTLYTAFDTKTYVDGDCVLKEGESGTDFYIVKSGNVVIKKKNESGVFSEVASLTSGEYFGEMALLKEEPRMADVVAKGPVECFSLNQSKFESLLGPLQDILNREADNRKLKAETETAIDFKDLEVITTLGTGTFGRVKLVRHNRTQSMYAMKIMPKAQVVAFKQTHNFLHEKNILAMCHHPFILRLHQTFKDANNLYLLLEMVQGGELFTFLHCSERSEEYVGNDHACFYASNVLLAFEYLHERSILYRDLKPENLLIDHEGYIKVVDFGFAKIVQNRTFTLCGTPEYLAPELVLGKGHNKVRILIYNIYFSLYKNVNAN